MKFQKQFIALLAVSVWLTWAGGGCASPGTYPTLKQTDVNVYWSMYPVRNASYFGKLTLDERRRVDQVYANYKTAYDQALQAAGGNYNAPTPENVKTLANEVINVTSAIQIPP